MVVVKMVGGVRGDVVAIMIMMMRVVVRVLVGVMRAARGRLVRLIAEHGIFPPKVLELFLSLIGALL